MLITIEQSPFLLGWSFEMKLVSTYSDEIISKIMCHLIMCLNFPPEPNDPTMTTLQQLVVGTQTRRAI